MLNPATPPSNFIDYDQVFIHFVPCSSNFFSTIFITFHTFVILAAVRHGLIAVALNSFISLS